MNVSEAANLLSTKPSEHSLPPAEEKVEGQEAQAKQEAQPEVKQEKQETPEAKASSDTEAKPNLHKVKVDGEELEVDYDELLKGYSRESHYQRKAKELSKEKETISLKAKELDDSINDAKLIIEDERSKLDSDEMKALREDDPDRYLREVDRINAKVQKYEKLKEKKENEAKLKADEKLAKERELLFEAFPEWSDENVMKKEAEVILKSLEDNGFSKDELETLTDHRLFVLAKKAMKYDELESMDLDKKVEQKKLKGVDPVGEQTKREASNVQKAREKFNKSRRWQDAAKLLSTN